MKYILPLIITSCLLAAPASAAEPEQQCDYDREALLAMDPWDFDQDFENGWRVLEDQEGCLDEAADLIHEFYTTREMVDGMRRLMKWHEGQIRAELEQTEHAIELMRHADSEENTDSWNYYVRATIAFLERDKDELKHNREQLAQVPRPDDLPTPTDEDGNEIEIEWPMNLSIVDSLIACFDKPIMEAYMGCEAE